MFVILNVLFELLELFGLFILFMVEFDDVPDEFGFWFEDEVVVLADGGCELAFEFSLSLLAGLLFGEVVLIEGFLSSCFVDLRGVGGFLRCGGLGSAFGGFTGLVAGTSTEEAETGGVGGV